MKSLGKKVAFVALLVGALAIPLTGFAQTSAPQAAYSNFDAFLAKHPTDARALSRNPALANNPQWLEHHPGAKHFFDTHKNVRRGMRSNASRFMSSTQNRGNQWGNYPNANGFTGRHPHEGAQYQKGWAHRHGHDSDHDDSRGSHGHHWAQWHGEHPGHGHHWAYGHNKQDKWEHGHHGNWEHGQGDHGHDVD